MKTAAIAGDGTAAVGVEGIGDVSARHVIAADGMWSPTRKALGLDTDGYLGEWHALRQYVGGVTGAAAAELIVWFEADLLPGYAWSFPLPDGRANVGFGVLRDGTPSGKDVRDLWDGLLDRPHIAAALGPGAQAEGRHLAWPIPARIDRAVLTHGPFLFTGDAAGGDGRDDRRGHRSGAADRTPRRRGDRGRRLHRRRSPATTPARCAPNWSPTIACRRCSAECCAGARAPTGRWRSSPTPATWGRRNFARWMFEDEPRAIAVTPRRWHRRFLARPGAYAHLPAD